jgi:hypothetical protein
LNYFLVCCGVESIILPIPIDNNDISTTIKVEIVPQPTWMTIVSGVISVFSNKLSNSGPNPFTVVLTDTLLLKRSYTANITVNNRPDWIVGRAPEASVTVKTGGEMKSVDYGSLYSYDPDNDSY